MNLRLLTVMIFSSILPFEQVSVTANPIGSVHLSNSSTSVYLKKKPSLYKHFSHRAYLKSLHARLPLLSSGDVALPSNAFNFHGGVKASVNPRTGNAEFSFNTSSLLYNDGQNKRDLVLSWAGNPSPFTRDTFNLSPHWTWNIGTEHVSASEVAGHKTTDISTGDGHNITMISDRDTHGYTVWHPFRHKIDDVVITGTPGDWTISLDSGVREHLKNGYEDWEETREGRRIWFYYNSDSTHDTSRQLRYICGHPLTSSALKKHDNACKDAGVWLTYTANSVTVHGTQKIILHKKRFWNMSRLSSIETPPLSSPETPSHARPASIYFGYDDSNNLPWLLRRVDFPTGKTTVFHYNEESGHPDSRTPGLATGIHKVRFPVVTEMINQSKNKTVPDRHILYYYGATKKDTHNYIGYQGNRITIPGEDNLFDRPDNYTYDVTQDNGLVRTTITYNKYHLPLTAVQRDDKSQSIIASNKEVYPPWKGTHFSQLPANYSLTTKTIKTIIGLNDSGSALSLQYPKIIESWKYDNRGQVLWHRDAYGRETFTQYCPVSGDAHCPAMDPKWPQISRPEKILFVPSFRSPRGSLPSIKFTSRSDQPTHAIETTFDYVRLSASPSHKIRGKQISGSSVHFWQIKKKTTATIPMVSLTGVKPGDSLPEIQAGEEVTRTLYNYNTEAGSPWYGQLSKITIMKNSPDNLPAKKPWSGLFTFDTLPPEHQEKLTIGIAHHLDKKENIRSTSMYILSDSGGKNRPGQGLSNNYLGVATYSLKSGKKISSYDALHTMRTLWMYDIWNRPIKKTMVPTTGGKPKTVTWSYSGSKAGNVVVKTRANGYQEKVVSGPDGELISTWHRFSNHKGSENTGDNTDGWIPDAEYTYTRFGKIASSTLWHASDSGKAIPLTTTFGYDSLNRKVWQKTPDGKIVFHIHDDKNLRQINYFVVTKKTMKGSIVKMGPVLSVVKANILGKPIATWLFPLDPKVKRNNRPLYSEALQHTLETLKSKLGPISILGTNNGYGLLPVTGNYGVFSFINKALAEKSWLVSTSTQYNGYGQKTSHTDPHGGVTQWIWKNGELVATRTPDGRLIHDEYNLEGKKTARCMRPAGSNQCHLLGRKGYDKLGNLAWREDETGNKIHYRYDADSRLTDIITPATKNSAKGHHFTYHYNSIGITEADIDGQPYARYTYDPVTWELTDKEDKISHEHYNYNETGQLISVISSAPQQIVALSGIQYPFGKKTVTYDRYAHVTSYADQFGNEYKSNHDFLGRVIAEKVRLPGRLQDTLLNATTYNMFGKPETTINGIGISRHFTYNSLGALASTEDKKGKRSLLRLAYTYDFGTGNILTLRREEGNAFAVRKYSYDIANNLTSMSCKGNTQGQQSLCPREIDTRESELTEAPIIISQKYTFDTWNNIKNVTEMLVSHDNKKVTKTTTYFYAEKNRDNHHPDAFDPHKMVAFNVHWSGQNHSTKPHVIGWDGLGRMVCDGYGNKLRYNAFGQQDEFINAATHEVTRYTYDSLGHQVAEQPFNARDVALQPPLYMIYSGNSVVAQVQKDTAGKTHTSIELGNIARIEDNVLGNWYFHDYKGDVISAFNRNGDQSEDNIYSPYGMKYNMKARERDQIMPDSLTLTKQGPWWQNHKPGFNGQMTDIATGFQFLGGGYRAYNPVLRHFMAHDSFSPFREIDGFGFANNNPVMNSDPSGHDATSATMMAIFGVALSATLGILMPAATAGLLGPFTIYTAAAILGAVGAGAVSVVSGSLQLASISHPHNKTLMSASEGFNIFNGIVTVLFGATAMMPGIALAAMASGVGKLTGSIIAGSGISGAISGLMSTAQSSLGNNSLVTSSGFAAAMQVISSINMLFVGTSIIAGIGAGISELVLTNLDELKAFFSEDENVVAKSKSTQSSLSSSPQTNRSLSSSPINEVAPVENSYGLDIEDVQAAMGENGFAMIRKIIQFNDIKVSDTNNISLAATEENTMPVLRLDISSAAGVKFVGPKAIYFTDEATGFDFSLSIAELKTIILMRSTLARKYRGMPGLRIEWILPETSISEPYGALSQCSNPSGLLRAFNEHSYDLNWIDMISVALGLKQ